MARLILAFLIAGWALLTPLTAHAAPSSRDWSAANLIRTECGNDLECAAGVIRLARSNAVYAALTAACGGLAGPDATAETNACWQRGQAAVNARH